MTIQKAKESGFTHVGTTYGFIKIYAKDVDYEPDVVGTNLFWDGLLDIFTAIDLALEINEGFSMWVTEMK